MVRVSRQKLKKKTLRQINDRLIDTVARLETNSSTREFFDDLLGEEEKTVLAKRLSVIFMLQEKISWYKISRLLKVSESTVKRIALDIDSERYENILKIVRQRKNRLTFWTGMDLVLKLEIPSLVGRGQWNILDEIYERYNLSKNKLK